MATSSLGFVDNWQAGKTLAESNLHMFNTEDSSDVIFRCGENGQVIKAHRYVLISRSCVFHAMFSDPLAEKTDISVPEIDATFFQQLLKYLYTDDIKVDSDNATALFYAARKYAVSGLENRCQRFINENLTVQNACVILEAAHHFDEKELCGKALTLIKGEGERSLQSPDFLSLSQVLVDEIIESDDLNADEHVVFTAVNNWAEAECGRQRREVTPEAKRSVLGETLLKVRFPLMNLEFLAEDVKASGLLTNKDRLSIQDYIISPTNNILPFGNNVRHRQERFRQSMSRGRFNSIYNVEWFKGWSVGNKVDAISFKSNKDIVIYGYRLYSQYQNTGKVDYRVTSSFGREDSLLYTVQKDAAYSAEGELFAVILPQPISVTAGKWYTVAVLMVGPNTWQGMDGVSHVVCDDGVEFDFKKSRKSTNGTKVLGGQIPSLIYSVTYRQYDNMLEVAT